MRLALLHHGHRPLQKLQLKLIAAMVGQLPGPIATMSYRRNLFGRWLSSCFVEAMEKPKHWTRGETELFAAYVSDQNRCRY
jgi:hypothetical protein